MGIGWKIAALAIDVGTFICAAVNAAYFLHRLLDPSEQRAARRAALVALSLLSFAVLLEAALLAEATRGGDAGVTGSDGWTLVRALTFVGTAAVSALIARKAAAR